jgi:hypothetical protein
MNTDIEQWAIDRMEEQDCIIEKLQYALMLCSPTSDRAARLKHEALMGHE